MIKKEIEVEIRFWIDDLSYIENYISEIYIETLKIIDWKTLFFGKEIIENGQLLRLTEVSDKNGIFWFAGWKDRDEGKIANIRNEYNESVDIKNISSFIANNKLNYNKVDSWRSFDEIDFFSGQKKYMQFSGKNYCTYLADNDSFLKIMTTTSKNWPILVEIEKVAESMNMAVDLENDLINFAKKIGVEDRLIRHEPPTLLYEQIFGSKQPIEFTAK